MWNGQAFKASSEHQMIWVWPNIPCWFLHYLCVGGQGRWVPPGWPSGHLCSESSAILLFPSTQPTQTPGERQFLNRWRRTKDCYSLGQMCGINTMSCVIGNKNLKIRHWHDFQWNGMRQKTREAFFFEEEDGSLPVDLPPTPAPPAPTKKKLYYVEPTRSDRGSLLFFLGRKPTEGCR